MHALHYASSWVATHMCSRMLSTGYRMSMLHALMAGLHGHLGWKRLSHHHCYRRKALLIQFPARNLVSKPNYSKQFPIVTPAMLFSAQIPVAQLDTHSLPAKFQQGALSGPGNDKMVGMQIPRERTQMPGEVVGFERQGVCCATSGQYGERQSAKTLSTNSDKTVSKTPRRLSWRDRSEL
jgi:hypothetical protein